VISVLDVMLIGGSKLSSAGGSLRYGGEINGAEKDLAGYRTVVFHLDISFLLFSCEAVVIGAVVALQAENVTR
jgi:hypothetical protein